MKILVAVKRVVDAKIKVRPLPDESGVDTKLAKMAMNPFDEIAVEKAVSLKEAGQADEVVVMSIGPAKTLDTIRVGLAMGADRGVHVHTDDALTPLSVAKILAKVVEKESPDVVMLGKQAVDDDAAQVGPMLAALIDAPCATALSSLDVEAGAVRAVRESDAGQLEVRLAMPCVLTADLRLASPRYVTLPMMGKARKKEVEALEAADLGVSTAARSRVLKVTRPPQKERGIMVSNVDELIEALKARHAF